MSPLPLPESPPAVECVRRARAAAEYWAAVLDGYAHYPLAQWRNGQWADPMLAHAGTEAVRLVPFSSLLLSAQSLSEYRSSAWRLPLCQDAVRIMISWRHFVRLSRGECDDVQVASALGALGPRAHRAQSLRRTCCFRRRSLRVPKQRVGPERGGAKFEHYYARWRPGRAVGA